MKSLMLSALFIMISGLVLADPACNVPKDKWLPEAGFKKDLQAQGDRIKTFKVSKGPCCEIHGFDKVGKKVEIVFDPATGQPIERL